MPASRPGFPRGTSLARTPGRGTTAMADWERPVSALSLLGLGAAIMYLLDPDGGSRRRARVRDRVVRLGHATRDGLGTAVTRGGDRLRGAVAELRRDDDPTP